MLKKENIILGLILLFFVVLITASQFEAKNRLAEYIAQGGDSVNTGKKSVGKKIQIPLKNFTDIVFEENVKVDIIGASTYEIVCNKEDEVLSKLRVENGTLIFSGDISFLIKVKKLKSIKVTNNAQINLVGFVSDSCNLGLSQNSSVNVKNSTIDKLILSSSGASSLLIVDAIIENIDVNLKEKCNVQIRSKVKFLSGKADNEVNFIATNVDSLQMQTSGLGYFLQKNTF